MRAIFSSAVAITAVLLSFAVSTSVCAAAAYYVATNGNDSWDGLAPSWNGTDGPFATLHRAQLAMESSTIKTTYIRAGTYYLTSIGDPCSLHQNGGGEGLVLSAPADNGETWAGYPDDPRLSAIIDGRSISGSTGLASGVCVRGGFTSPVKFTNLKWQHFDLSAIYASSPIIVTNSEFTQWTWIQGTALDGGAIDVSGATTSITSGYQISNNYFHDSYGDAVELVANAVGALNNSVISDNTVINTCTSVNLSRHVVAGDCGALYVGNPLTKGDSTNIRIIGNYVRDVYLAGGGVFNVDGGNAGIGIYLDNAADNVTIANNVVTGIMNVGFFIHGGSNNHIINNIYDESDISSHSRDNPYILIDQVEGGKYGSMNTNNTFTNNIIVSRGSNGGGGYRGFGAADSPLIQNNAYHNYVGSTINSTGGGGVKGDSNPIYENPKLCGWTYKIAAGSPVYDAPVRFPAQSSNWAAAGFWGPPGFVIPQTGTKPSVPLTCG